MKINLLITFFITLFFLGCQSNIENETIKNIQSDNLPEKFFSVDSNLVVYQQNLFIKKKKLKILFLMERNVVYLRCIL